MEDEQISYDNQIRDFEDEFLVPEDHDEDDVLRPDPQPFGRPFGTERPHQDEARRSTRLKPRDNRSRSDRGRKAHNFWRIVWCLSILVVTALIAVAAGYEISLHNKVSSTSLDHQEVVRPGSLIWSNATNVTEVSREEESSPQYLTVKNVTVLGPQHSTSVTNVSRDGGSSVLLNGKIVWLYDDTASRNRSGSILSFLSNTAAYSSEPNGSITLVRDFGVVLANQRDPFKLETGILAKDVVQNGGWIPFTEAEAEINKKDPTQERVAIWPGTAPTPLNRTNAILFAPLVNVYGQVQNFSDEYQAKGMTLLSITAPESGPVARREVDQIIPDGQVPFGGFATLIGNSHDPKDLHPNNSSFTPPKVLYMFGIAKNGIQLARVLLQDAADFAKWTFFDPQKRVFVSTAPALEEDDASKVYLQGSFSSGSIFYSPYFGTFIMVYFKKNGDSTFYFRYLNLAKDIYDGKSFGSAIQSTFVEYLSEFQWSAEAVLYESPPGPGGYNYAGTAHPEFFNRDYYSGLGLGEVNPWYGQNVVAVPAARDDGKHLMLSWTSQLQGGANTGVYQIVMAVVEFNDLTNPSDFYGPRHDFDGVAPTATISAPTLSPTTPSQTSTPSSLPGSSFNSRAGRLHGHSFWTMLCKLAFVGAAAKWLTTII